MRVAWGSRVNACAQPGRLLVEVGWRNAETAAPFYCLLLHSGFFKLPGQAGVKH